MSYNDDNDDDDDDEEEEKQEEARKRSVIRSKMERLGKFSGEFLFASPDSNASSGTKRFVSPACLDRGERHLVDASRSRRGRDNVVKSSSRPDPPLGAFARI